jgi:hypothetical protein
MTHHPLPPSPPLSGGARPHASIRLVSNHGDPSQGVSQPEADVSQRGSREAGAGTPLDMADQPVRKRRRRRSKEGGSKEAGKQRHTSMREIR